VSPFVWGFGAIDALIVAQAAVAARDQRRNSRKQKK
jgi:hypothetical protein